MKYCLKFYHFLGGIRFALILITVSAFFVVVGTFIESRTQSHRLAANVTYHHPFFALLLWGFFINIFFSAIRRWPFQVRHLPFLITHFGLLMILAGVLIKAYFGEQGTMEIIEGSASQIIFTSDTYMIYLEKKGEIQSKGYELKSSVLGGFDTQIADAEDGLQLHLIDYYPNSSEHLSTWIKGNFGSIRGLNPLPLHTFNILTPSEKLPISGKTRFYQEGSPVWNLYAFHTMNVNELIDRMYREGMHIVLTERKSGIVLADVDLSELDGDSFLLSQGKEKYSQAVLKQHLGYSEINGFVHPYVEIKIELSGEAHHHQMIIPLNGDSALFNINRSTPYLGSLPISVDFKREPCLAIIEDDQNDTHLIAFDPYGGVWCQPFRSDSIHSLIAYEEGFGGYAIQSKPLFSIYPFARRDREAALLHHVKTKIRHAITDNPKLSPPLRQFQKACDDVGVDFVDTFVAFLKHWDQSHSWLYPEDFPLSPSLVPTFNKLEWEALKQEKQSCYWTARLFKQIDPILQKSADVSEVLRANNWPFTRDLEEKSLEEEEPSVEKTSSSMLKLLTQQMFSISDILPSIPSEISFDIRSGERQAMLYTAHLRAYGVHLSSIANIPLEGMDQVMRDYFSNEFKDIEIPEIVLETSVIPQQINRILEKKLEDNIPKISLHARYQNFSQTFSLTYDRYASGLKWPILNGEYLVRFQPKFMEIPYSIRLRNARQINYANSNQPFSYESDIVVTELSTGHTVEKTISMNHVHETWDGYRFYLANISPSTEDAVKRIQIIVNHDPAKYWLTYPGALILSLGIILLFWLKPYRKGKYL